MSLIQEEKTVPVLEKPKISSIIRGLVGKFKVGKCRLYNQHDDSFCILGALGFAGGMTREDILNHQYTGIKKIYPQLADNVNVDGENYTELTNRLFNLNDAGYTWNEIADKVEELGY